MIELLHLITVLFRLYMYVSLPRRLCFQFGLLVCLFVRLSFCLSIISSITQKSYEQIAMEFY